MRAILVSMKFFATLLAGAAFLLIPSVSFAALIYTEASGPAYGPGDTLIVTVRLDNEGECINAGRVVLSYPQSILKPVDFSRGSSLFSLWVAEPVFDTTGGSVIFEGGTPGGYCGRIQGDPALSNVLGRVVFTVIGAGASSASVKPTLDSALYLSDGLGTRAVVRTEGVSLTVLPESVGAENPWLTIVGDDDLPPESFTVVVESTDNVLRGNYYAVFSTVDKQSGMSHYEIFERDAWRKVESPYELKDQSLAGGIQIKAIDKAGNERVGTFYPELVPERRARPSYLLYVGAAVILAAAGFGAAYLDRLRNGQGTV